MIWQRTHIGLISHISLGWKRRVTYTLEVIAIATPQIEAVIERLATDRAFRVKYCQDPEGTLEMYLTPDEIRAIKTGDGHRLGQLGCDESWDRLTAALCGPDPGS